MRHLYFLTLLSFLSSCHKQGLPTQAATTPPERIGTGSNAATTAPQISFLQIKVSKKDTIYEAKMTSRKEVAGILDRDLKGIQLFENQWLISFFDDKKQLLEQVTVPNPLDEHFEVADDKGNLKGVQVKKQEADFFFRVQYNPKIKSFQVEQILAAQKKKKLFSLIF